MPISKLMIVATNTSVDIVINAMTCGLSARVSSTSSTFPRILSVDLATLSNLPVANLNPLLRFSVVCYGGWLKE